MEEKRKNELKVSLLTGIAISTMTLYLLLSVPGCPRRLRGVGQKNNEIRNEYLNVERLREEKYKFDRNYL